MSEQVETVTLQSLQEKTLKEMYGFAKHYKNSLLRSNE